MLVHMVIDGVEVPEDGDGYDPLTLLLLESARGDQRAFAEFYDLLAPRVFGLILRVLVDRSQSEEVLQEVFFEIWQTSGTFNADRGGARTWVMTMAHRRAVDRVRSAQASTGRDERIGVRDAHSHPDAVDELAQLRIDGGRATRALAELPEAQREPLVLAYFGGYSQREIAVLVDAPLGTVKTRMRDGLTKLRRVMEVER